MQLKWKRDHLAAVISIIYAVNLAEAFDLDKDVTITKITETSVAIMSWSYSGTLPGGAFSTRLIEKKNASSFEIVLNYSPFTGNTNRLGVFENKNVSYMESPDMLTMTVYDFEKQFLGEYRLTVERSSGGPAVSGPTIFYLCQEPEEANLTAQILENNILLTCAVQSNSLGEEHRQNVTRIYYWKVNNGSVVAGDNYEFNNNIEENSVNSSLVIKDIEVEMNGNNYICFAVEEGCGMASPLSSPYMLQVEDLPTCQSCKNGGTCNQTTLKCICLDGFTGDTCDKGPDDPGAECKWWCILLIVLPMVIVVIVIICCCWHYKVACFRHKCCPWSSNHSRPSTAACSKVDVNDVERTVTSGSHGNKQDAGNKDSPYRDVHRPDRNMPQKGGSHGLQVPQGVPVTNSDQKRPMPSPGRKTVLPPLEDPERSKKKKKKNRKSREEE